MAQNSNIQSTLRSKTMDELYQDYIHSLGIVKPKPSDFHLTEEIIKKIEDKSLNSCPDGKAIVDDITKLKKTVESEYEEKSLSNKYIHFLDSGYFHLVYVLITLFMGYVIFKIMDRADFIVIVVLSIFFTPLCACLVLLLTYCYDYIAKKIYVKKHLEKKIEIKLLNTLSLTAKETFYEQYLKALKEYNDKIDNIIIIIPWKNVKFQDGNISCYIDIFNKKYFWNIPRSLLLYDKYRQMLMRQFPDLYFRYKDGNIILFTNSVNIAIDIIIKFIEDEEIERIERERQEEERRKKEIEEIERIKQERKKAMDDFYKLHPDLIREHNTQNEIINRLTKYDKSIYLDYLLKKQLEGIDVISVWEDCTHTSTSAADEKAYIFIIPSGSTHYCLVYETVREDFASIRYRNSSLEKCLDAAVKIRRYMQSSKVNKRLTIRNGKFIDDLRVYSIDHDGLTYWINKIHRHY